MIYTGIYLFAGVLLGLAFVKFAIMDAANPVRRVGHALLIASVIYVAFAMGAMQRAWLLIELGGVALFGIFVVLGFRRSPRWLAAGWALHVLWDAPLHTATDVTFVPEWFPVLCVGFDLVMAVYVLRSTRAWADRRTLTGVGS